MVEIDRAEYKKIALNEISIKANSQQYLTR